MDNFVSLHNHTCFSMMHSIIKPIDLFTRAKEIGQPAIAVTDSGTIAAAWDAFKASKKTGVKLIIGNEFFFVPDFKNENEKITHVILLAKNHTGYKNLLLANKLANDSFVLRFGKVTPRINWEILEQCSEGVICLTACGGGLLSYLINTRRHDEAFERAKRLKGIFGENLALEIQPHAMVRESNSYNDYEDQSLVNRKLVQFGEKLDIKVVATTNAHYLYKKQWESHDALLSIGSRLPVRAVSRPKYTSHEFYVKSREEVETFLRRYFDDKAKEFCDNTLFFADMCEKPEWIDPKYSNPSGKELPQFQVYKQPDYKEYQTWLNEGDKRPEDVTYLEYACEKALNKINITENATAETIAVRVKRVEKELDVFECKDLSSYMLIVADYVNWTKDNNIPIGPGRGSAGASFVAYLLGIHDADSIKYDLTFERFYNKQKTGLSDIDLDFSQKGKPRVEEYIVKKYGKEYCAKVSNFSTLRPKPYAKYITKAFQLGKNSKDTVELGNSIADAIPKELNTVSNLIENAPLYAEYAELYPPLKEHAKNLGNLIINYSTHAGAIVIGKRPLVEIVPLRMSKDRQVTIEYEKDNTEACGLAKMDILGLSTLDIIDETFKLIKACGKTPPSLPWNYDENDKKTYDLISSGKTYGVFQLGKSASTAGLCVSMEPKNIEDLAMINSMARPGFPKEVRNDFIEAKKTNTVCNVIHESLKDSLAPTFGFALFDESLLNIAKDVAGWDLDEADRLRKFVKEKGKSPAKDKKLKEDFISSTIKNEIEPEMAHRIWDEVISNYGSYIFNKAHAVVYSFISYQTAYLKAHFPTEFLICNLIHEDDSNAQSSERNKQIIKNEIRSLNIKIHPPDLNKSNDRYIILDSANILSGLNSLKYMGKDAIPEILSNRPYSSLEDFLSKVDGTKVKAPAVQALTASGAFDHFGYTRKEMFLHASDYKKKLQAWNKRQDKSEKLALKNKAEFVRSSFKYPWPENTGEWTMAEKYAMEVYYLGEAFCCNTAQGYESLFDNRALDFTRLPDLFPMPEKENEKYFIPSYEGVVEGVLKDYFEFQVKNEKSKIFGETMAKVDIEDKWGNIIPMTIFPRGLNQFHTRLRTLTRSKVKLEPGIGVHCSASANWYEGDISLVFEDLKKVHSIPPKPKDLKHRIVSMKTKIIRDKTKKLDPNKFLDLIEDELILEGHSGEEI